MKKFAVAALVVAGVLAGAAPAGAAEIGPCATVSSLVDKYNLNLGMHIPVVEDTYHEVCRQTG